MGEGGESPATGEKIDHKCGKGRVKLQKIPPELPVAPEQFPFAQGKGIRPTDPRRHPTEHPTDPGRVGVRGKPFIEHGGEQLNQPLGHKVSEPDGNRTGTCDEGVERLGVVAVPFRGEKMVVIDIHQHPPVMTEGGSKSPLAPGK